MACCHDLADLDTCESAFLLHRYELLRVFTNRLPLSQISTACLALDMASMESSDARYVELVCIRMEADFE